jgi:hypothetical protein
MQQKDRFPKFTVSSRELGSAPANEAINILVIVAPRGIMILSLIRTNCSSFTDFSRSKMSVRKVNIEWQASLCCTVIPIIAQFTRAGNIGDGMNKCGQ